MKLSSHFSLLISLLLTSAIPAKPTEWTTIEVREDSWDWPECTKTGAGFCTLYLATSDPDASSPYRAAAIFDSECNILQAVMGIPTTPKLTLKGTLNYFVDVYVDTNLQPRGKILYYGVETPLDNSQACYKPPFSDGTGCRKAFACP